MRLDKFPPGLLEAFNLKQLGQAPTAFGDTVIPVTESFDLYTSDRLLSSEATAVVGAFNQSVYDVLTSPQRVRGIGFQFVEGAAAGTFMHWALGVRVPHSGSVISWLGNGSFGTIAAGASRYGGISFEPVTLPPGASVCGFFTSDAIGADHNFRVNKLATNLAS